MSAWVLPRQYIGASRYAHTSRAPIYWRFAFKVLNRNVLKKWRMELLCSVLGTPTTCSMSHKTYPEKHMHVSVVSQLLSTNQNHSIRCKIYFTPKYSIFWKVTTSYIHTRYIYSDQFHTYWSFLRFWHSLRLVTSIESSLSPITPIVDLFESLWKET